MTFYQSMVKARKAQVHMSSLEIDRVVVTDEFDIETCHWLL